MTIYHEYAAVYDASGQLAFSLRMIPYLNLLLTRHPVEKRVMIELACGTGTVAIAYADAGWRVYGIDGSADMLAQARAKAMGNSAQVIWSQQDMRSFVVPERVGLVTCLYDSMNYMLTNKDLLAVFRRVHDALLPGGLFLFDMNTVAAMAQLWDDETYFSDANDLSVVFQSQYDDRIQRTTVQVTCFQRVQDALYRKIVERHTEQAYPREQIATFLTDVGFAIEGHYDCPSFADPTDDTHRIMWVARRAGV